MLASLLAYSASVGNPIVYGLMSSRYRDAFRDVLRIVCPALFRARGNDQAPTQVGNRDLAVPSL